MLNHLLKHSTTGYNILMSADKETAVTLLLGQLCYSLPEAAAESVKPAIVHYVSTVMLARQQISAQAPG